MIPVNADRVIKISQSNQAPTDISLSAISITENAGANAVVGTLSATDADAGDTATFTLVSGDGDNDNTSFTIDGTALKTAASFDYETKSSYSVRVRVTDGGGLTYEKQFAILVLNVEDAAPSKPGGLATTKVTHNSISLSWSPATDDTAVDGYNIFRNGQYVASTRATSYTISGLTPSSTHTISVQAYDSVRNRSARSTALSVTTVAPQETTVPSIPTNLAFSNLTGTSAAVKWDASTDNVGVTGYNVYVNGVYNKTTTTRATTITGLTGSTSYSITVLAYDAAKNRSARSTALNITTLDNVKPTAPTNVASSNVTKTGARVTWTAATDNVAVTFYNIYRNGAYVATVSGTTTAYNLSGLTAGTTYSVTVRAIDAAKNFTNSTALSVPTLP
jgi:chitodextrinase